jgi:hypothetical protein
MLIFIIYLILILFHFLHFINHFIFIIIIKITITTTTTDSYIFHAQFFDLFIIIINFIRSFDLSVLNFIYYNFYYYNFIFIMGHKVVVSFDTNGSYY